MDDETLAKFERQIEALLQNYERIRQDNAVLREKQDQLVEECRVLGEKNQKAVSSIERTIDRLKTIETDNE